MREPIKEILAYNKPEFQYIKLAEELAELSEVIIKRYLKKDPHKPPIEKIIEELGDVKLRIELLIAQENIHYHVEDRILQKSNKLLNYIDNGEYKGGV